MARIPAIKSYPLATVGNSNVYKTNLMTTPFNIGFGVLVSGTVNYSVQHTFDDVYEMTDPNTSATWFDNTYVRSTVASMDGNYAFPVAAIRVHVSSRTTADGGSVTMNLIQTGTGGNT